MPPPLHHFQCPDPPRDVLARKDAATAGAGAAAFAPHVPPGRAEEVAFATAASLRTTLPTRAVCRPDMLLLTPLAQWRVGGRGGGGGEVG